MALVKRFWIWCTQHVLLVTVLAVLSLSVMALVNIEILHMTSEPEFCAMCHPGHGFGPLAEVDSWEHSGHAAAGVSCLDCHGRPGPLGYAKAKMGGLKDLYMQFTISKEEKMAILSNPDADLVPMEQCLFCHSDSENQKYRENHRGPLEIVEMRLLDHVENPDFRQRKGLPDILSETQVGGTHFDHAFHMESFDLTCRDCHFGVVHQPKSKTERMNQCITCHSNFAETSAPQIADCTVCHQVQLDMNIGQGAQGVAGETSLMYGADISCEMCHTGVASGVYRPSASNCTDCHEAAYREIYQEWGSETRNQLERMHALRAETENALKKADEVRRDTKNGWEIYRTALANLKFVKSDGTDGVHNRFYVQDILETVEADFNRILNDLKHTW